MALRAVQERPINVDEFWELFGDRKIELVRGIIVAGGEPLVEWLFRHSEMLGIRVSGEPPGNPATAPRP